MHDEHQAKGVMAWRTQWIFAFLSNLLILLAEFVLFSYAYAGRAVL